MNAALADSFKKARSGSAVSRQVGAKGRTISSSLASADLLPSPPRSKGEELDGLGEAAGVVLATGLVVLLLSGILSNHPQPEKTMILVVEGNRGVDGCLKSSKTLCRSSLGELQSGAEGNADGKIQA